VHSLTGNKDKEILSIRIVLDRSGSMSGSQSITVEALNTYLTELKKEKGINGSITLSTFDSVSIDIPISRVSIERLDSFPESILQPRGGTPLFDAIGLAIHDLENISGSTDENKVLVIVTDGFENASKEYTFDNISSKIKEKEDAGWLIIYLGADHDAFTQSNSLNFDKERSMRYSKEDSIDTFRAVTRTTIDYQKGEGNKNIRFTEEERTRSDKKRFKEGE
tara:strand:- start:42 stop:707 length:666 start_codon:yes stop_codon:yes gene_type:complete